jgi:hypothetical protein
MDEEEIAAIKAGYAAHAQRVNARLGYRYVAPAAPQPAPIKPAMVPQPVAQLATVVVPQPAVAPAAPVQPVKPKATASARRDSQIRKYDWAIAIVVGVATFLLVNAFVGGLSCNDGWHSPSIGRPGACSHHRGVAGNPSVLFGLMAGFAAYFVAKHATAASD